MTYVKDLTNQRFGMLVVVEFAGIVDHHANWRCKCDCGNTTERTSNRLRLNVSKIISCGCYRYSKEWYLLERSKKYGPATARLLRDYIKGARKRNIKWELSDDEAINFFSGSCFYCGKPPSKVIKLSRSSQIICNGIDRLDHKKGYFLQNCVSCCSRCNQAKGRMTYDEFIQVTIDVSEYLKSK